MLYIKLYKKFKPGRKIILRLCFPIMWSLLIPFVIMDIWVEIYHRIFFPLYKTPYVKRENYIQIMDRARLPYLTIKQKLHCIYCGYMNGLVNYWVEIGAQTEHFWCGIQHRSKPKFVARDTQKDFSKYGDKNDFIKKYCSK